MTPEVRPSTKEERYLSKQVDKWKEDAKAHKAGLDHLKRDITRMKKKHLEYMRMICKDKSRDHRVNVCDRDDGPTRCNKNSIDDCPHRIFVYGDEK